MGDVLPAALGRVPRRLRRPRAGGVPDALARDPLRRLARPARQPGLGAVPGQRPGRGAGAHGALLRAAAPRRGTRLDPVRAAALEVEWWRAHREAQHDASVGPEALVDALATLYAHVYDVDRAAVREAAALRAEAMDVSDRWVAAGHDAEDPLLETERALLVRSSAALLAAVHR